MRVRPRDQVGSGTDAISIESGSRAQGDDSGDSYARRSRESYGRSHPLRRLLSSAALTWRRALGAVQQRSADHFSQGLGQLARTNEQEAVAETDSIRENERTEIEAAVAAANTLGEYSRLMDDRRVGPELEKKLDAKIQQIAEERRALIRTRGYTRAMVERDLEEGGAGFLWRVLGVHDVTKKVPPEGAGIGRMDNSHVRWMLGLLEWQTPSAGDVFYDIGAGVGFVTKLMSLLTDATIKGIEIDEDYNRKAKTTAEALGLSVDHVLAEATTVDYSDGSYFYLFNPFPPWRGEENAARFLKGTLEKIRAAAEKRKIFVVTTCMPDLPARDWLEVVARRNGLTIYRSH
jgi:predicted RNA methylase